MKSDQVHNTGLKKSVQAPSLEDHLDLEQSEVRFEEPPASSGGSCEGGTSSKAVNERPSTISMPPVASNGSGEDQAGSQLVCAVQVGRKPPTLWYLGGGIRIGVRARRASACLAAKR